jgi:uncharacterized MAPEG superfamily protein
MTTPFWCLLIAILLPIVLSMTGGYFRLREFGSMDNKHPRLQAAKLEGIGSRAYAAQQNAWEALAMFTAAVAVAHMAGADPGRSATAALIFVGARVLHPIFYLANIDAVRSLTFFVSLGSCIWLFVLAAQA